MNSYRKVAQSENGLLTKLSPCLGLGLLFLWGISFMCCYQWVDTKPLLTRALGWVGAGLATVSGIGLFMYINHLEQLTQKLEGQILALNEVLETERNKTRSGIR